MDIEEATWAAVSGAVLSVFWPWMLAQWMLQLSPIRIDPIRK